LVRKDIQAELVVAVHNQALQDHQMQVVAEEAEELAELVPQQLLQLQQLVLADLGQYGHILVRLYFMLEEEAVVVHHP
jgi:hypothetical protein